MEKSFGHRMTAREKGKALENIHLNHLLCTNLSCGAVQSPESAFCRHCSCDICGLYDVNKDPSLWIVCKPDCPEYDSCRKNFHIECAIKGGCMGVGDTGLFMPRDASFWCTTCGNISDILGCWKTQLSLAKDAEFVKDLCYRLSLAYRLLDRTLMYVALHDPVKEAKSVLEKELGPIDQVSDTVGRGTVSSVSVAHDVQKFCDDAIKKLASTPEWAPNPRGREGEPRSACRILVTEVSTSAFALNLIDTPTMLMDSATGLHIWYWRYRLESVPQEPVASFAAFHRKFTISNLRPSAEYAIRVLLFAEAGSNFSILGVSEAKCLLKGAAHIHQNPDPPVTVGSGEENPCPERNLCDTRMSSEGIRGAYGSPSGMYVPVISVYPEETGRAEVYLNAGIEQDCGPSERTAGYEAVDCSLPSPITHLMDLNADPLPDLNQDLTPPSEPSLAEDSICLDPDIGSDNVDASRGIEKNDQKHDSPKKSSCLNEGIHSLVEPTVQLNNQGHQNWIHTIRGLECEGHISHAFRLKFISWFSFKATEEQKRIVYSYLQHLSDDRQCLGEQLVHSFADIIVDQAQTQVISLN